MFERSDPIIPLMTNFLTQVQLGTDGNQGHKTVYITYTIRWWAMQCVSYYTRFHWYIGAGLDLINRFSHDTCGSLQASSRMSWYGCVQWFEVIGWHSRMLWYGCVQWFEVSGEHSRMTTIYRKYLCYKLYTLSVTDHILDKVLRFMSTTTKYTTELFLSN